jgi:predicted ATP-binding protein involved in virulence
MNKTLNRLIKDKNAVFIIGTMGSGKTILANQIENTYKIYEDVHYMYKDKERIRKEYDILSDIAKSRHLNKKIIVTTYGKLNKRFLPQFTGNTYDYQDRCYILIDVSAQMISEYNSSVNTIFPLSLLYQQREKFYNMIKHKRKTRPYLLFTNNQEFHFGRFKLQEKTK